MKPIKVRIKFKRRLRQYAIIDIKRDVQINWAWTKEGALDLCVIHNYEPAK